MNENPKIHPFFSQYKTHDKDSQVLILGSFPSENSEKYGFYYGDKKNRFWSVLGEVLGESKLKEMEISDKIEFLHKNHIALWDIWAKCYKTKPSNADSSIDYNKSARANLNEILENRKIKKIFTTIGGSTMSKNPRGRYFKRWCIEDWLWEDYAKYFPHCKTKNEIVCPLYSTSGANWRTAREKLIDDYSQILEYIR